MQGSYAAPDTAMRLDRCPFCAAIEHAGAMIPPLPCHHVPAGFKAMKKHEPKPGKGGKDKMIAGKEACQTPTAPLEGAPGKGDPKAAIDLERLVWDPEYRKAMRHLLQRKD